jgi:hypothetical protein
MELKWGSLKKLADCIPGNPMGEIMGGLAESACDSFLPEPFGDLAKIYVGAHYGDIHSVIDGVSELHDDVTTEVDTKGLKGEGKDLGDAEPTTHKSKLDSKILVDPKSPPPPTDDKAPPASASQPTKDTSGNVLNSEGAKKAKAWLDEHQNPEDFMNAIRNGEIPDDILNSQAGMMMIQQRLHEIQQCFQLLTQMLQAMHEMSMGIVRNVRA